MILYLSAEQIAALHARLIERFGGMHRLRDRRGLDAAAARPAMTFGGEDLYPDLASKSAALLHSLVQNHPFADGNKRVGAAAAELFLLVNGHGLSASDAELEGLVLATARGELAVEALAIWIRQRLVALD